MGYGRALAEIIELWRSQVVNPNKFILLSLRIGGVTAVATQGGIYIGSNDPERRAAEAQRVKGVYT